MALWAEIAAFPSMKMLHSVARRGKLGGLFLTQGSSLRSQPWAVGRNAVGVVSGE